METKKVYDANGNLVELTNDDFKLVQVDSKIHDKKFETKATTYGKDALKRFVKNRSSVVGFFIIALLLFLALVYPVISPYDVSKIHTKESLLDPKLFEPTEGSWNTTWNGTKLFTGVAYDATVGAPLKDKDAGTYYNTNAIVAKNVTTNYVNILQNSNSQASGGTYILAANKKSGTSNIYVYEPINYNVTDGFIFKFTTSNIDLSNNSEFESFANSLAKYRVYIEYGDIIVSGKFHKFTNDSKILELIPWTKEYKSYEINISEMISKAGLEVLENGRITIEIECASNGFSYIPIEKFEVTVENEDAKEIVLQRNANSEFVEVEYLTKDVLAQISLSDPQQKKVLTTSNDGSIPLGYWKGNANSYVYNASYTVCDFVYDYYEDTFGNKITKEVDIMLLREYRDKGWCTFDDSKIENIVSTFKVTSDKCPVVRVVSSQEATDSTGMTVIDIQTETTMYKYYGYKSMPKYILGTDREGKDLITISFKALRTSLLLSICVSAICLTFGLCWGAISGYFGGNVDLFMERFCDILGGVPWIVVMTLAILLLGNNILTFAMALCLTGWMGTAGRTRTQFYRFKGREYILASRTLGSSDKRLIFRHILPNSLGTIVTGSVLSIPSVIFSEASLSYLNLGLQGTDSFGVILSDNQQYLNSHPALIIFPAIIISLLMISFNLFGNGLRDALNPSLKGSE